MALRTPRTPRIVTVANGGVPEIREYPEADSQTFDAGQLVYLASGSVTEVAANGQVVLGIALAAGTNVTSSNPDVPVMIINPGDIVEIESTTTAGVVGTNYALVVDTSGTPDVTQLDVSDTTNDAVVLLKQLADRNGTTITRSLVRFNPSVLQSQNGA